MAEIVASDTPYARATTLGTRTQGFRGDTLPSATWPQLYSPPRNWSFCCYRKWKRSEMPPAQYRLVGFSTDTRSFQLWGRTSGVAPRDRRSAAARRRGALPQPVDTRRLRPPLPAVVPCAAARVASRSAPLGWPGSSARCNPASVVAGSPSSRLHSASYVRESSSGTICSRGRRTSSSARPNHRVRFAPGGVPVTTLKRRRIARNGVRDPLCFVRTIEVLSGSVPQRCCRCFYYSG